jgi:hypothetical protein
MNAQERLIEQAEARKALADAETNLRNIRATLWMYTDSEGTEFSSAKGDALWARAKDDYRAAQARDKVAYVAYTDPLRLKPQNQESE